MRDLAEIERKIRELSKASKVIVIGVAGGSCSGKSFISRILADDVEGTMLSMDDYYRGVEFTEDGNFDKPDALDLELLGKHIAELKRGESIRKPVYDFKTHARSGYETFEPAEVVIAEGLFALHDMVCGELDVKIFVEADVSTCLERRIERDMKERGRTAESVVKQFTEIVQPMHREYVEPEKEVADYIIVND